MHSNTNNTGIISHCWSHIWLLIICTKLSVTGQLTWRVNLYVNFSNLSLVLCIFPDDSSKRPKHVGEIYNGFHPYLFSYVGFWWHKEGNCCSYMRILMVWQVYVDPHYLLQNSRTWKLHHKFINKKYFCCTVMYPRLLG